MVFRIYRTEDFLMRMRRLLLVNREYVLGKGKVVNGSSSRWDTVENYAA